MTQGASSRPGTKRALLAAMLERKAGASIPELVAATGWQAKSIHSAIATLRKSGCQIAVTGPYGQKRYRS